ncbi:DcaP family trimeric outer membrane transporter [Sphingomonas sp.]|jgi:hypothetical protein|uniref:DcaP family trimeric outer membrane transporter n=1 Tax=Sphingomonas sp. TaxID=28214 RepID=UPI002623EB05|nr:DcaP family trimeric outer membrane transporter [Sphingomonas sp.]MDF2496322.1 porin [Sphingomonas sp.]
MRRIGLTVMAAYVSLADGQAQGVGQSAESFDALQAEVRELRQAVADLRSQLQQVAAVRDSQSVQPSAPSASSPRLTQKMLTPAPAIASATTASGRSAPASRGPTRETFNDELTGVARPDTEAPPNNPNLRGYFEIPGTETMIRLGGFAKVNGIYDFSPAGNTESFVTSSIPVGPRQGKNANISANPTRLSLDVRRPSALGPLRFYLESDFVGSSGTDFNLRQAQGQIGNTYAGYGLSAFMDADAFPETLDDEGPNAALFLRVAALRQIFKLGGGWAATLSIEDPSSQLNLPVGATTEQPMPDIAGSVRMQRNWGHVQAAGVMRRIGYRLNDTQYSAFAWGLALTGLVKVEGDFFMAGFAYGEGIARYFNDLGGDNLDGVIAPDGKVHPLKGYGGYYGFTHHWNASLRSNVVGGVLKLDNDGFLPDTAFRSSRYAAANLIYQLSPNFSVGGEGLYGRHQLQNRQDADVVRVQVSLKYDLVR